MTKSELLEIIYTNLEDHGPDSIGEVFVQDGQITVIDDTAQEWVIIIFRRTTNDPRRVLPHGTPPRV